ncbi:hypothetical protein BLNAU_5934 [Blattamonas nauphoetae]|uniref:Uncharacterized protein n=1 Tax=Blattamonas nauphoetae TaxID=2049346 RepID=A0ABQ9Y627_9EUKA|nr:hypothetical protein BLNAU_5934 [Blattamonas nauphoetae]
MINILFSLSFLVLADDPSPIGHAYLKYGSPNSANCTFSHPCHSLDVAIAKSQKEKLYNFTFQIMEHTVLIDEFAPSVTQFGQDTTFDVELVMTGVDNTDFAIYGTGTILLEGTSDKAIKLTFQRTCTLATSHNPGGTTKDYYICIKKYATFSGDVIIQPLDKSVYRPTTHVATLDTTKWDGSGPFVFQVDGGTIKESALQSLECNDPSAAILDIRSTEGLGTSLTFPAIQRALYSEVIRQVKVTNTTEFTLEIDNKITQGIAIKNSGCEITFNNHSAGEPVPDKTTTDLFLDGEAKKLDADNNKVDLPVNMGIALVGKQGHFFNLTTKSDIVLAGFSVGSYSDYSSFGPAVWNDYIVEVMRTKYTKSFSDKAQSEWVEMKKLVGHGGAKPLQEGYYEPKSSFFRPTEVMMYVLDTSEIKTKGDFYSVRVRTTTGTHAYIDRVSQLTDHDLKYMEQLL